MSELTSCCFCTLREIRESVDPTKEILEARPEPEDFAPKAVAVYVRPIDEELDVEKHFVAWLGEVTKSCCC